MTYYADLEPCTYFDRHGCLSSRPILAVGWLAGDQPFAQGPASAEFVAALFALLDGCWELIPCRGGHFCEICRQGVHTMTHLDTGVVVKKIGITNVLVPHTDRSELFAAPSLVAHYVVDHGYLPPEEFRASVVSCPRGSAYFERVHPMLRAEHPMYSGPTTLCWLNAFGETLAREHGLVSASELTRIDRDRGHGRSVWNRTSWLPEPDPELMDRYHRPIVELAERLESAGHGARGAALRAWASQVARTAKIRPVTAEELEAHRVERAELAARVQTRLRSHPPASE